MRYENGNSCDDEVLPKRIFFIFSIFILTRGVPQRPFFKYQCSLVVAMVCPVLQPRCRMHGKERCFVSPQVASRLTPSEVCDWLNPSLVAMDTILSLKSSQTSFCLSSTTSALFHNRGNPHYNWEDLQYDAFFSAIMGSSSSSRSSGFHYPA